MGASFNAHNYHLMFYSNIITALIEKFAYKLSGSTETKIRVKTYNERNGKRIFSEIWSIVNQQISLEPGEVNSLGELTNHLETIIRNRKHIKNLPSKVEDSLPDILDDMRENHRSAIAVILQGPNDEKMMRSPPVGGKQKGRDVDWMLATPIAGHIKTLKREYEAKKLLSIDYNDLHALEDNLVAHICRQEDPSKLSLPSNSKCYFNEGKGQGYKGLTIYNSLERISQFRDVGRCCKAICEKGDLLYTLKLDQTCTEILQNTVIGSTNEKIHDFCNSN